MPNNYVHSTKVYSTAQFYEAVIVIHIQTICQLNNMHRIKYYREDGIIVKHFLS